MYNYKNILLKQWQAFIGITQNLKNVSNPNKNVQDIIEIVIDTISKVDAGFLLLWDSGDEVLRIEAAVNFKEEYYIHNKLSVGEGISGTVFKTGKTMVLYGEEQIEKAMESMKEPNYQYYLKSSVQNSPPKSCLSVPITYQQQKIGVLTLDNFFSEERFTDEEIGFVEAIATQIAMVITLGQEILEKEQRTHLLNDTILSHHLLNDIMLNDRGPKQLIITLSKIIKKDIFYLDHDGDFKFASHTNSSYNDEIITLIQAFIKEFPNDKHDDVVSIGKNYSLHIFKIASSYGITGYLIVDCKEHLLDDYSKLTLSHSTAIMAIEQMKEQKAIDSLIQKRQELLIHLNEANGKEKLNSELEIKYYQSFCFLFYKNNSFTEQNYSYLIQKERYYQAKLQPTGTCLFFPKQDFLLVLIALKQPQIQFEKKLKEIHSLNNYEQILMVLY